MTADGRPPVDSDDEPIHIASAVVLAAPERSAEVAERLAALPGVELHAGDVTDGRLVVSIEGARYRDVADTLMRLRDTEGVISSELVYQYSDGEAANDPVHEEKVS